MTQKYYRLGFIGIGLMGQPMTLRLLNAGHAVSVWTRNPKKLDTVCHAGAKACETINDLLNNSDIILLCLADSQVVADITREHIVPNAKPNQIVIDLSSIDPAVTRELAAQLQSQTGTAWVDAPVSGGVAGAEQGTLAIMAGGDSEHVDIARQVLKPLYQQLTHMGPVGSGQISKICNQMIVSCNVLVIAEMMALAKKSGVTAEKIPEALAGGFADSKPLQIVAPEMAAEQFEPIKWRIKTLLKDLQLAADLAESSAQSIPMSGLARQLMQLHSNQGFHDQDPATLIQMYTQSSEQ